MTILMRLRRIPLEFEKDMVSGIAFSIDSIDLLATADLYIEMVLEILWMKDLEHQRIYSTDIIIYIYIYI